jgi:hypothetical protein
MHPLYTVYSVSIATIHKLNNGRNFPWVFCVGCEGKGSTTVSRGSHIDIEWVFCLRYVNWRRKHSTRLVNFQMASVTDKYMIGQAERSDRRKYVPPLCMKVDQKNMKMLDQITHYALHQKKSVPFQNITISESWARRWNYYQGNIRQAQEAKQKPSCGSSWIKWKSAQLQ